MSGNIHVGRDLVYKQGSGVDPNCDSPLRVHQYLIATPANNKLGCDALLRRLTGDPRSD